MEEDHEACCKRVVTRLETPAACRSYCFSPSYQAVKLPGIVLVVRLPTDQPPRLSPIDMDYVQF